MSQNGPTTCQNPEFLLITRELQPELANDPVQPNFNDFAKALGSVVNFSAGQVLFRELDPPRFVYFILKGSVELSIHGRVVATINEGDAVGLLSLIDDQPRTVSAAILILAFWPIYREKSCVLV